LTAIVRSEHPLARLTSSRQLAFTEDLDSHRLALSKSPPPLALITLVRARRAVLGESLDFHRRHNEINDFPIIRQ
jgi:hypothetical protein